MKLSDQISNNGKFNFNKTPRHAQMLLPDQTSFKEMVTNGIHMMKITIFEDNLQEIMIQ
uniref:Uncharacterized protein n=1 Tax=Onchocerca volvulus TaxID=6282 RepID=A0A8R1TYN0_ONCVO